MNKNRITYIFIVFLMLLTILQAKGIQDTKTAVLINTPFAKGTLMTNGRWYGYLNQDNVKGKKVTKITTNILQAGVFKIGIGYLNPFIKENEVQIIKEVIFNDTGVKTIELNEVIPEDQYIFFTGYWGFSAGSNNPIGGGFIDFGNKYNNYDLGIGIEVEQAEIPTSDPNELVNTPLIEGTLAADGKWYGYLKQDNIKGKKVTKITTNILSTGVFKIGIGFLNPFIQEDKIQIIKEVRFYNTGVKTIELNEVIPEDQYLFFAGNWGFSSGADNPVGGGFISSNNKFYNYDLGIGIEVGSNEDIPTIDPCENSDPYEKGKEGSVHIWISEIGADYDGAGFRAYDFDKNQYRDINTGFQGTYKTIGVGEYEYTKENLKAINYNRNWGFDYTWFNWNIENISAISKSYNSETPLTTSDFTKTYGTWFSLIPVLSAYANPEHVKFRDKENGNEIQGWGLPSIEDILQMIGQMPSTGNLNQDLLNFVGASSKDVPAGHSSEWFNQCSNISGLTLTPLGSRESIEGDLTQYVYEFKKTSRIRLKSPLNEAIFSFSTNGSEFIPKLYHYTQIRYARAKTDQELGYKMYIDNCNDSVVIKPYNKFTKLTELPKGLERGIALRYMNRSDQKIYRKWSEICSEADKIRRTLKNTPERPELPISPCDDDDDEKADPYEKGKEGSVHIWISEIGADYDGAGFRAYDFDKNQYRDINTGFQGTYKTIGVGEYEYTKENLKAINYNRNWGFDYTWFNWNIENISAISKSYNSETPLTTSDFTKTYGTWFSLIPVLSAYANPEHVKFRDKENGNEIQGWGLPSIEDILQMIGQMPSTGNLNQDLLNFVGASSKDVPAGHSSEWFNQCSNISGLTLTPLGSRESIEGDLTQYVYEFKKTSRIRLKSPLNEAIFSFSTNGSEFIPKLYHYTQIRYARAKTDQELGYKIFVDLEKDSVIIAPLSQACDENLLEISHGLERGIVLRYSNIKSQKVFRSWSQIKEEALQIRNAYQNLPDTDPLKPCLNLEVTNVSLNKTQINLLVGETYNLVATIMPENAIDKLVIWSSSNESLATVNSIGQIKAIKEGSVTITVRTNNGGKTAICSVFIKKDNQEPEEPIIPDLPNIPKLPEDPKYPEISDNDYSLLFSYNGSGDRIERNVIILKTRASQDDVSNNIFTDRMSDHQIRIYPNPTKGQLMVEISDLPNIISGNIKIINLQGKIISNQPILNNQTNMDISNQSEGIYIMSIIVNGQTSSWKIIKE